MRLKGHISNIPMGEENMSENNAVKLPEVIVFAGPNGSGKTTITGMAKTVGEYINADDIKRTTLCTDIEAAQKAEELCDEPRGRGSWFISRRIVSQNDPLTPSPRSIKVHLCMEREYSKGDKKIA